MTTTKPITTPDAPHVWIGCLACYNDGTLRGEWVDAIDANEFVPCEGRGHEEWWVMDFEYFHGLLTSECSPMTAQKIAENIEAIEAEGHEVEAVAAWLDYTGETLTDDWSDHDEAFRDAFRGKFDSEKDYAYEIVEELGWGGVEQVPEGLRGYLDWDMIARDLHNDHYFVDTKDYSVYVFWAC